MQWLGCRDAKREDDEKSKSQALVEMLRQLFPQWEFAAVLNKAFRCKCKHLHSLVKALRWREVVTQITSWKHSRSSKPSSSTGVSIARRVKLRVGGNRLRSRQCAFFFFFDASLEQGRAKEFTALETQLFLSTRAALGEQMVNLRLWLKGDACKALRRRFFFKCFMYLLGRFFCAASISSRITCSASQWLCSRRSCRRSGSPLSNGNGPVAISKKRLSQLAIVMNRTTDRATMKVRFNADEQELLKKRCTNWRSVLRTVQRELANSALNQATMR